MIIAFLTDAQQPILWGGQLAQVPFNVTKVVRNIKRNRAAATAPEGGWPVISDADISQYAAAQIGPVGDSWTQLMRQEDEQITMEELRATPADQVGALQRAAERIAVLNDPNQ